MAFPAQLYAVPDAPAPKKRKPAAVELKKAASAAAEQESRRKRKIEQAHRLLQKIEERQKALAAQIAALQKRRGALAERAERISDRILNEMQLAHLERVDGIRVTFQARLAPASLVVDDEQAIPEDYFREKVVTSIDKIAIKSAMERGVDIPGVHLEQKVSLVRR